MTAEAGASAVAAVEAPALTELGQVPWREPTDERFLRRYGRIWLCWTVAYTIPFLAAGVGLVLLEPMAFPVALASLAHAWIIPELYAFRGASVLRPKGARNRRGEEVAQGLLGDLLTHEARDLHRHTGLAMERSGMGVWLVGEAGALLFPYGARRVHSFCVRATDGQLPPSDRIAHLLLALRTDEQGFATVANHVFAGATWRVRRRLPAAMRPALDVARTSRSRAGRG